MRNSRTRITLFVLFVAACIVASAGYAVRRVGLARTEPAVSLMNPADARVAAMLDQFRASPHIVFQSRQPGTTLGYIAMTKLETPESPLVMETAECERSYFTRELGLCLELNRESMEPRAFGVILDRHFQELTRFPLAGLPIRARISPDQRYAAATVFVTGESYGGDFTTRTTIIDLTTKLIANLEEFAVERDGKLFVKVDFNFWGVTFFQDGNLFYATLGTGGERLLVEGDIASRRFRVVGSDVECPSLSPDGRHLVFKRRRPAGPGWQLWARDLMTTREWPITDDGQDVDDQVDWLDNSKVIYGLLSGQGPPEASLSLWTSDITPASGLNQRLYLRSALSPSVIR